MSVQWGHGALSNLLKECRRSMRPRAVQSRLSRPLFFQLNARFNGNLYSSQSYQKSASTPSLPPARGSFGDRIGKDKGTTSETKDISKEDLEWRRIFLAPISAEPDDASPSYSSLRSAMRTALRSVPQSVVIVTSTDPHLEDVVGSLKGTKNHKYKGMTVSSFNSVSLDPDPIVSFNIKLPSSTYDAIINSGGFMVHTLSGSRTATAIADYFSKGIRHFEGDQAPFTVASEDPENEVGEEDNMTQENDTAPPLLAAKATVSPIYGTVTFPYAFRCSLADQFPVSDHMIITGKVTKIFHSDRGPKLTLGRPVGKPVIGVVYADGNYRNTVDRKSNPTSNRPPGNALDEFEQKIRELREQVDLGYALPKGELFQKISDMVFDPVKDLLGEFCHLVDPRRSLDKAAFVSRLDGLSRAAARQRARDANVLNIDQKGKDNGVDRKKLLPRSMVETRHPEKRLPSRPKVYETEVPKRVAVEPTYWPDTKA